MSKVRYIDFSPDNFLVGVMGMKPEEIATYWVVCSLIYSGRKPIDEDDDRIWKISGITARRWPGIKKVLLDKGKLTLSDGQLINGRSVEELDKAGARIIASQENGKLGGRPPKAVSADPAPEKHTENTGETQPNTGRSASDELPLRTPEPSEHNDLAKPTGFSEKNLSTNHQPPSEEPPIAPQGARRSDAERKAEFDRWYAVYPRKVDPGRARKAFDRARQRATLEQLCNGARSYAEQERRKGTEKNFIKHPSTWLNAESWLSEPDDLLGAPASGNPFPDTPYFRTWVPRIRDFKRTGVWLNGYGPPRGEPGCVIPRAVLERWDEI